MTYIAHIGVGLTQLLNTVLGGWPDESTSSRLWRLERPGKVAGRLFRPRVDRLFFWQPEHCARAYAAERTRYHLPPMLRNPN